LEEAGDVLALCIEEDIEKDMMTYWRSDLEAGDLLVSNSFESPDGHFVPLHDQMNRTQHVSFMVGKNLKDPSPAGSLW
jgi:hypothetical protein